MKKIIIAIIISIMLSTKVNAQSYTTTTDASENTYTNNLIGMAVNDKTIYKNDYIIFRENDNYYLIIGDLELNNNLLTGNNTKVYKAERTTSGYNYYYTYTKEEQNNSNITINNLVLANINGNSTSSSNIVEQIKQRETEKNVYKLIIGIMFAIFLIKGRTSI